MVSKSSYLSIHSYEYLIPNKNSSREDWDWTKAIQTASSDAANLGKRLFFLSEVYKVFDTLLIDFGFNRCHWIGYGATIKFENHVIDKPLLHLSRLSTFSTFEGIQFTDAKKRVSKAVRISAYPYEPGLFKTAYKEPNWKNLFLRCRFDDFKTAIHFTTDGSVTVNTKQGWASETLFLHSKIKNCELSVLNQNLQSLNNVFIQTDIENDFKDEHYTMVRDEAGGGLIFTECSLIGKGYFYEWAVPEGAIGLFPNGILHVSNCRFEVRPGHKGQIFRQDPSGDYRSVASSLNITVSACDFTLYGQTVDLIKYTGRVLAKFSELNISNGKVIVRNHPVQGASATITKGSLGKVEVVRSPNVIYEMDVSTDYGETNQRYVNRVSVDSVFPTALSTMSTDSYGFYNCNSAQQQLSYGLTEVKPSRLVWSDPSEVSGFKSVKLIVPKWARLTNFGFWKQPVRFHQDIQFKLYLVKDVVTWAKPGAFNVNTDAYLVSSTESTLNKAGLFESPIQLNSNSLGYRMESGFGDKWTEGRIYIEFSNKTSNQSACGFVYVEYI